MNGTKNLNLECIHIPTIVNYINNTSNFCSICGAIYESKKVKLLKIKYRILQLNYVTLITSMKL